MRICCSNQCVKAQCKVLGIKLQGETITLIFSRHPAAARGYAANKKKITIKLN